MNTRGMNELRISLSEAEWLALTSLVESDRANGGADRDEAHVAQDLLRRALHARLPELGLLTTPDHDAADAPATRPPFDAVPTEPVSSGAVAAQPAGEAAAADSERPRTVLQELRQNRRVMIGVRAVLVLAAVVVLFGGYVLRWQWTGFPANNQLWNWLQLLLLPVVLATVPVWLKHAEHMGRKRQLGYVAFIVGSGLFILAGYVAPMVWTGFRGNTLWDWLVLVLLPITLVMITTWPTTGRSIRAASRRAGTAAHGLARHRDRGLRVGLDLDGLSRQHLVGLASVGAGATRPASIPATGARRLYQRRRGASGGKGDGEAG